MFNLKSPTAHDNVRYQAVKYVWKLLFFTLLIGWLGVTFLITVKGKMFIRTENPYMFHPDDRLDRMVVEPMPNQWSTYRLWI